ncbi:MAG: hypothetical protein SPJ78_01390 [Corynebacterium camporealensis]|uniref:hypothetical protein n=1 Tax=Corynebacterium camporealensis TaxID=161896 RepID=UPI002A915739|nr:hypothetical protein [Corynebacterium camporealensis]MDY5839367.1 hypothetical protein [Corynebacterium camporealensis]
MGLMDKLRELTGKGPRLAEIDVDAREVDIDKLRVRTAETMVILETNNTGAALIREIARSGEAVTLKSSESTVHFSPSKQKRLPVRDPKRGWVLALDKELSAALADVPDAGDYEISPALAVVVE